MKSLMLVDFSNICYRCIYVAESDAKKEAMSEYEMYAYWKHLVVNAVVRLIDEHKPTKVVIASDVKESWRKEIYPEYKENRKKKRENSIIDFDKFYEVWGDFEPKFAQAFSNLVFLKVDRSEADDIIATLTEHQTASYDQIVVISNDGDYCQLLKFCNVKLMRPINGGKYEQVVSLNPQYDLDVKVIAGDRNDNIMGIKERCGPATAMKILKEGLDTYLEDPVIKENYIRNKTLIDFNMIPSDIKENIIKIYSEYQTKPIKWFSTSCFLNSQGLFKLSEENLTNVRAING